MADDESNEPSPPCVAMPPDWDPAFDLLPGNVVDDEAYCVRALLELVDEVVALEERVDGGRRGLARARSVNAPEPCEFGHPAHVGHLVAVHDALAAAPPVQRGISRRGNL